MHQRLRRVVGATVIVAAASCGPRSPALIEGRGAPLAPRGGGAAQINVRELEARPKLAVIQRHGDPRAALVVAVAAAEGVTAHAALAGLLERRLRAAGLDVDVQSDGLGVRTALDVSPETTEAALVAWVKAVRAPVSKAELAAAEARVDALRRAPLASSLLEPMARCSGEPAAVASVVQPPDVAQLEKWRASALVMERTAVAVVGDALAVRAANDAMEDVDGWPRGSVASPPRPSSQHGAFLSPDVTAGAARLHVSVHVGDAVSAVGTAYRLRRGPPLSSKLDALKSPWRVASVRAVALPKGGCIRVELEGAAIHEAGDARAVSAARAAGVVRRELGLQAALDTDPFLVTREIIAAGDAREAAARAAWWALSVAGETPPSFSSALEVGAGVADGDPPVDEEALHASFLQHMSRNVAVDAPIAARRFRTERGQGQLWMMIASPCALRQEGQWNAGMAAVAATAAAAQNVDPHVVVEPWVSADGVGVIAHGGVLEVDETAESLTERVARAAAEAYATVPHDRRAFVVAQRAALQHTATDLGAPFFLLARRTLPDHPSWVAPWGDGSRSAASTLDDVAAHWREVLHEPARVAVIGNHDDSQGRVAARVADQWLLTEAADRPCGAVVAEPDTVEAGRHLVTSATPMVMVGVPYRSAAERVLAELTAVTLTTEQDALATSGHPWVVRVVGGRRGGALVVMARVSGEALTAATQTVVDRLDELATSGPDQAMLKRAQERLTEDRRTARQHPRERLVALWLGEPKTPAASLAAWRTWLSQRATKNRLVVVTSR